MKAAQVMGLKIHVQKIIYIEVRRNNQYWYVIIWWPEIWYDTIWYDIFNYNWVDTRWQ
jgi:hypothetical protein